MKAPINRRYTISVVLPAYNEEQALPDLVRGLCSILEQATVDYQVLIIDDGSTDATAEVALSLKAEHPKVDLVRHERNRGLGAALRSGIENARFEYWAWLPADGEFASVEIQKLLNNGGRHSVIVSYPQTASSIRSPFRRILSYCYQHVLRFSFGHKLKYFNGPALYRRELLQEKAIVSSGFSATAEILIRALDQSSDCLEVPLMLKPRKGGRSKAVSLKVLANLLCSWAVIWWHLRVRPLRNVR